MSVNLLGDGNNDGTNVGRSGDKLGFYGLTTPIVKPSFTQAAITDTAPVNASAYGFTSAQAAGILALVNEIRAKLVAFGLVTT